MSDEIAADGPCVAVRAPAKVNLFLAVRGRRDDGYHEIVTVLQTVSVYDRLRVGVVGPPGRGHHPSARRRMRVVLVSDDPTGLPDDPADNLSVRAARVLAARAGLGRLGVAGPAASPHSPSDPPRTVLSLHKGIPIAGGMAGGSADAAATLLALNELWELEYSAEDLRELGAELGSDVPFSLVGGTALATGRGTGLAQVLCRGTFHWVVCRHDATLLTGEVYGAWDAHCQGSEVEPDAVLAALRAQDAVALGAALHNDLEPAAFKLRPTLADDKDALLAAGALGAVVSGSGPTLLALAEDAAAAARLAEAVAPRFAATTVAVSPVGGPEVRAEPELPGRS